MIKYAKIKDKEEGICEVGLGTNIGFYQSVGMTLQDVKQSDVDGLWYLAEKCPMKTEEEKAEEEHLRILDLSMTRSDFFDGTIKAFGADSEDLLKAIEYVLGGLEIADVDKKVALNNYRNALNFYRKHPLFSMLSDVEIPVSEGVNITISSEQWDRFFDETDKKNPEAYKELLPSDPQMTHNEEA